MFRVSGSSVYTSRSLTYLGLKNRANGSNTVNEHSSRSHSVLTLNIDSEIYDEEDDKLCMTRHGKLAFVDLAGHLLIHPVKQKNVVTGRQLFSQNKTKKAVTNFPHTHTHTHTDAHFSVVVNGARKIFNLMS